MTSCNNDVSTLRMQTHTTYQCWYPKTNGTRICDPRKVGTATVATKNILAIPLAARSERKLDGMHTWWGKRWCSTSITPCRCHSVIVCLLFVAVAPSSPWWCSRPPHLQLEYPRGIQTKYENDNRSEIKIESTKQNSLSLGTSWWDMEPPPHFFLLVLLPQPWWCIYFSFVVVFPRDDNNNNTFY